jgi:GcrA cell cycle regulator
MRGQAWTAERIARLKELWGQGATADAIAQCLGGTSRSAVLGKIFRLRLGGGAATPSVNSAAAQSVGSSAAAPPPMPRDIVPVRRRARPRRYKPRLPRQKAVPARGRTLLELTNETCRWPFGQPGTPRFHFCGVPAADLERGLPYCEHHMRRAYSADAIETTNHPAAADGAHGTPKAFVRALGGRSFRFGSSRQR